MMSNGTTSPGVAAADDQPPVLRERVEPLLEELAADVLEDEVDAAAVGRPHHLLDHVLRRVVDPDVQAELAARGRASRRSSALPITNAPASWASWTAAEPMPLPTELIRTRSAEPSRPRVKSMCQAVPKAIWVAAAASSLRLVGDPDQVPDRAGELLRVAARGREADEAGREAERLAPGPAVDALAAGRHQVRHHALADLPAGDALAERSDPPDDLDAEDERRLDREARDPFADVDVEVVQRRGEDVERDLARAGLRIGELLTCRTSEPPNSSNTTAFTTRPPSSDDE